MKRRSILPLLSISLLLSLVLWHATTEKSAQAAMQANYPLNPASFTSLGASPFTSAGTYTIDASKNNTKPILTKPDNTTIQGVFFTSSGGEFAVFTFDTINIPADVTVQGKRNANSRPIALLSKGTITIDGVVDVSGADGGDQTGGAAGPGGGGGGGAGYVQVPPGTGGVGFVNGNIGSSTAGGSGGSVIPNGGGAGGTGVPSPPTHFFAPGGAGAYGGNGSSNPPSLSGGTAYGDLATSLQGGSGGGGGANAATGGGGGGGAVEIGASTTITISGTVTAVGGIGSHAFGAFGPGSGGAGGGILIHGDTLTLTCAAKVTANGSDGGGGGRVRLVATTIQTGLALSSIVTVAGAARVHRSSLDSGAAGVLTTSTTPTTSQAATRLKFFNQPSNQIVNSSFDLVVFVTDDCGAQILNSASVTLALDTNSGGATLGGNLTVTATNGLASFTGLTVNKPGTGYTLKVSSNGLANATSNAFNVTCQAITVSPVAGALTAATVGTTYSQQFSQANGNGTISWSIAPRSPSTKTPPGLSIDSTGKLSGTPTEAGNFSFTVTATDGAGCPGSTNYSLVVNCPTVTLPTLTLSDGTYNSAYPATTVMPTGGTAPYSFTVSGLPAGMTRTPSAGNSGANLTLSGTPTQTGSFTVQVSVTDAYGCAGGQQSYALKINPATPVITWNTPADIVYGTLLSSTQLNATANVPGSFVYTPPLNILFNAGNGQTLAVTFTPTDTTNYNNATKSVAINVLKATPVITWNPPAFLPTGALSASVLNATANVAGTFSYTPSAGTVLAAGSVTITANFTPSDAVNYNPASQSVMLPVLDSSCGTTVNPATLPAATRGTPFVQTLSGSPVGSYTFSLLSGTLPPGVSLVNTLGIYSLRGTPTTAGTYQFTIKAKKNNATCEGARTYIVRVP